MSIAYACPTWIPGSTFGSRVPLVSQGVIGGHWGSLGFIGGHWGSLVFLDTPIYTTCLKNKLKQYILSIYCEKWKNSLSTSSKADAIVNRKTLVWKSIILTYCLVLKPSRDQSECTTQI